MTRDFANKSPAHSLSHQTLRTPDERFHALSDWPYAPTFISGLLADVPEWRIHYVDEGPKDAEKTFLCLHGQRAWSYSFRQFIERATAMGHRVIAMDYLGFGRSDKPIEDSVYTFGLHRQTILRLIEHLELDSFSIVGFDWGGWIGTTLPMALGNKVEGLILGNMTHQLPGPPPWQGFYMWLASHNAQADPEISCRLLQSEVALEDAARASFIAGYDAPFPDSRFKAGVRKFPNLIPHQAETEAATLTRDAQAFLQKDWTGRCQMIVGAKDPVLGVESMQRLHAIIRHAQAPIVLDDAGPLVFEYVDQFFSRLIL